MIIEADQWNRRIMTIGPDGTITLYSPDEPEQFTRPLVTIRPDGTIEPGEGYTPDAAAQAFWDAVSMVHPGFRKAGER